MQRGKTLLCCKFQTFCGFGEDGCTRITRVSVTCCVHWHHAELIVFAFLESTYDGRRLFRRKHSDLHAKYSSDFNVESDSACYFVINVLMFVTVAKYS